MNINLDGFRQQLVKDMNALGESLTRAANEGVEIDEDELEDFNIVAQSINILCCIYDNETENFSDLSEKIKVYFLGEE